MNDRWQPLLVLWGVFQTFQAPNESLPNSTTFHHGKAFKGGVSFFFGEGRENFWRCELLQNSSKDLTKALGSSWIIHLMTCLPAKRSLFLCTRMQTIRLSTLSAYWSRGFSPSSRQEFGLAFKGFVARLKPGVDSIFIGFPSWAGCPSWASLCSLKSLHCNRSKLIGSHATMLPPVMWVMFRFPMITSAVRTGVVGPWPFWRVW